MFIIADLHTYHMEEYDSTFENRHIRAFGGNCDRPGALGEPSWSPEEADKTKRTRVQLAGPDQLAGVRCASVPDGPVYVIVLMEDTLQRFQMFPHAVKEYKQLFSLIKNYLRSNIT